MTVRNDTSAPRVASNTRTEPSATSTTGGSDKFASQEELATYLKEGPEVLSAQYLLAGVTNATENPEEKIKNSSWVKAFEKGVQEAVAKLGDNPSKEEVKNAVNNEMFKQRIMKFAVDRASNRIMERVKEMYSDTFK